MLKLPDSKCKEEILFYCSSLANPVRLRRTTGSALAVAFYSINSRISWFNKIGQYFMIRGETFCTCQLSSFSVVNVKTIWLRRNIDEKTGNRWQDHHG
jgi:hypothetical protein